VPSTQKLLVHCAPALQVAPFAWAAVQTPAEHQVPPVQSASELQLPTHPAAPQANAPQSCVCSGGQPPRPSQLAASTATPWAQLPARHVTVLPG
jgi:hypothetical protein